MQEKQIVYKSEIKRKRGIISFLSILGCISSGSAVSFALITKYFIDNTNQNSILYYGLILFGFALLGIVAQYFYLYFMNKSINELEIEIKDNILNRLIDSPYSEIRKNKYEEYLTYFNMDARVISEGVISIIPSFFSLISKLVFSLLILFLIDYIFASIFLGCGLLIFLSTNILRKKNKIFHKAMLKEEANALSFYNESIININLFKIFGNIPSLKEKEIELNESLMYARNKKFNFNLIINSAFSLIVKASYLLAILYFALGFNTAFTVGSMFSAVQLISNIEGPFTSLSGLYSKYYSTTSSIERVNQIKSEEINGLKPTKEFRFSSIELKDVSYTLDDKNIIKDTSFTINSGDFIAIKGSSGSGKTTLINLIMGLYCVNSGSIIINNDENIYDISSLCAYVPQNPFIVYGSIEENLKYFNPNATNEQIINILNILNLSKYTNNLDLTLSNINSGLSTGEIQRICIARALLTNREIYIFDEASSALDKENEEILLKYLKGLNKTIIFVSHKDDVFKYATKEILIKDNVALLRKLN